MTTDKNSLGYKMGRAIGALVCLCILGLLVWAVVVIAQGIGGAVGF